MSTPNLSLWDIEQAVLGLSEILESPDATEEEKQAARAELERWVEAEVAKVDRVRGFLRHCAVMEEAARAEATAMAGRAIKWGERGHRLKEICLAVMDARGVKRLEGQSGVLRKQANGGKQALKITNESLIPDDYRVFKFSLTAKLWQQLQATLQRAAISEEREWSENAVMRACLATVLQQIDEARLRAALERKEHVPGAELEERSCHLRVE